MSEKIVKEIIEEAKKRLKEIFGDGIGIIDISEEKVRKYLKEVRKKEEKECRLCIDID